MCQEVFVDSRKASGVRLDSWQRTALARDEVRARPFDAIELELGALWV
jgi:hypothetical protein